MLVKTCQPIPVKYVISENGTKGSSKAFDLLESKLPTLSGRKFFGVLYGKPDEGEYRACIESTKTEAKRVGVPLGEIPGGIYVQEKIWDWEENLSHIGKVVGKIMKEHTFDSTRPVIEFYRSMKELRLLVPILNARS